MRFTPSCSPISRRLRGLSLKANEDVQQPNLQPFGDSQISDDFIRQPINEVVAVGFGAEVLQTQHCDDRPLDRANVRGAGRVQPGETRKQCTGRRRRSHLTANHLPTCSCNQNGGGRYPGCVRLESVLGRGFEWCQIRA